MSKVNTNVCIISGNLVRDAELKYTSSQKPVLTFTVAVNRLGANNEQATDYFNCVFWGKTGEVLQKFMTKGKGVLVRGQMRSRQYEAKDGRKVTAWELTAENFGGIELLGGGERSQNTHTSQNYGQPPKSKRNDWNPLDMEEQPPAHQTGQYQQADPNFPF